MKIIYILAFAMILSVMNSTMFNVALPALRTEFQLTSSQVSWVVTGYIIIYAIGSVTYGKLADRYKLKNLLTFGLLVFAIGSLLGFLAQNYAMVVAGRVLQSAGASVIPASSMVIPIRYVQAEQRGRALGITSSGMALGTALGPIVGGLVTSFADWRYLFAISLLSLVTIPCFRKYLNRDQTEATQMDAVGGVLLALSVTLLLLAITNTSILLGLLTIMLGIIFVWHSRRKRGEAPFIDLAMFANRNYTITLVIACLMLVFNLCVPYLIPQLLSSVNGMSSFQIGLVMFPGALVAAIFGIIGGRLADRRGNAFLLGIAFTLQLVTYGLLSLFTGSSYVVIMLLLVLGNTGLTFAQVGIANTVSRTLIGSQVGVGMGMYMMLSFICGAVGTTVLGLLLDHGYSGWAPNAVLRMPQGSVFSVIFLVFAVWIGVVFAGGFSLLRRGESDRENEQKVDITER
ncbi:MFS transporter [Paenibacillus kandeliae]|uniref:MFS transporter n=1 Tax=Paenibacillus kandeliae TaxID=3231269 RepID=UPI003459392B